MIASGLWKWGGLLLAYLGGILFPGYAVAENVVAEGSRFERVVSYLSRSDSELQSDFARIALEELAVLYGAESDLARSQSKGRGEESGSADLRLWARAVERYSDRFYLLLDDIELGFPVYLFTSGSAPIWVTVADRRVLLTHPRYAEQAVYEASVLERFCTANRCSQMVDVEEDARPIPVSSAPVRPVWTFAESGPVCTHRGVEVHFGNDFPLQRARPLCDQLLVEIQFLIHELTWLSRQGVNVQWRDLELRAVQGGGQHLLTLNAAGDSILATVPIVSASVGLLDDLTPWLRESVEGSSQNTLQLNASRYGWE